MKAIALIRRIHVLAVALTLTGCGENGMTDIAGTVTLDGVPVEQGSIRFAPRNGRGPTAGAIIESGQYAVSLEPGPKRVEIQGHKVVGQRRYEPMDPLSPMVPVTEPIVPEKYNTQSELTREIKPSGGKVDFALESS